MGFIEGKWYLCIKSFIATSGNIVFKKGRKYKLYRNGILQGENKVGVNLGEDREAFLKCFKDSPFDENTDPTPALTQYPKVMEVSDFPDFPKPLTRVVFMEKNGRFFVWNNAKTLEEAEKEIGVSSYKFAREVSSIVEVSKKEIAEWKGVDVSQIQIID